MKFKNFFILILFLITSLISCQIGFCDDVDMFLSEVEHNMNNIQSVQTSFIQKKYMAMFDMPITIKGKIYIENPGKFAWMVTDPIKYTLIISKDKVIKWDQSNGVKELSLKKNPMFKAMIEQITFWFSGSYASCKTDYDIKLVQNNPDILEFTPKEHNPASQMLKTIALSFQKDKNYISKIKLLEKNSDITELFFKDVIINGNIKKSVWEIK